MNRMTDDEILEIVQARKAGKQIRGQHLDAVHCFWFYVGPNHTWDFVNNRYRILETAEGDKQQPSDGAAAITGKEFLDARRLVAELEQRLSGEENANRVHNETISKQADQIHGLKKELQATKDELAELKRTPTPAPAANWAWKATGPTLNAIILTESDCMAEVVTELSRLATIRSLKPSAARVDTVTLLGRIEQSAFIRKTPI